MAKRISVLRRSKRVETVMARYLFGPEAARDWKERHDIRGEDALGEVWVGEVKSHAWPSGPGAMWMLLEKAFAQATQYGDYHIFAAWLPRGCHPGNAPVVYQHDGMWVVVPASQFRENVLGWCDDANDDVGAPGRAGSA